MDTSRTQKPERARRPPSPVQPAERPGAAPGPALPPGLDPQALIGLQQAFGNQAVQRLLARAAARRPARDQRGPPEALLPAGGPAGQAPPALMREEQEEPPAGDQPEHEAEGSSFFEGADDEAEWRRQEEAARRQEAEDQAFLQGFEVQARVNVINLLMGSEALVQVERERYGIPSPAVTADTMAAPRPERQVAAGGENEGLAAAAAELAVATRRVQALYPEAPDARPQYDMEGASYFDGTEHGDGPPEDAADAGGQAPPDPEALNAAIAQAEQDYAVLRTEKVAAYPILAMYAPATLAERGRPGLDALARGPSPEATALLAVDVAERLRNIKTTRTAIAAGTLDVWSLPRIVAITQTQLAASTRQAELIQRRVADAEWDELLGDIALSVLGLALGLAAIGTGMAGAPLAAAAFGALAGGVNAVLTYEHFQDYMIESAAASSDFEKARAIAAGEPSFFWLALDVVATLLDIKVAQVVFRRLLPLAAAAVGAVPEARSAAGRLGEVVSDTADEIPELRALREAGDDEMPGLGDTLVQSAIRADERGVARLAGDAPPGGAPAGDWGARGARLSLPGGSKAPARAVGDYWPEGAADPVRYSATSGRKGTPTPKSTLTQPERHVLKPPEPTDATRGFEPGEQYRGIPKGLTAEEREAWLRANKAEGHHPGSRAHDAEAKMFENLLNDTSARSAGEFHFKVTHPVCPSCKEMIFRFRQMRPGIQVIQHSP